MRPDSVEAIKVKHGIMLNSKFSRKCGFRIRSRFVIGSVFADKEYVEYGASRRRRPNLLLAVTFRHHFTFHSGGTTLQNAKCMV